MNKGIFRLVFSRRLGMYVPVPEIAKAHAESGSPSRRQRRALAALLSAASLHVASAAADQPAGLIPHATKLWSNAAIDAARTSASQMTIRQTAAKAILNWQQLNLNRGETLNFDQGGNRTWAALNRIYDANPSVISGNVNADGHIYFINQNGIIFGNGAQINVGSLTASTLDVTDDLFNAGILTKVASPVFVQNPVVPNGFVRVEAGAALTAATGGRVMLLAPNVTNSGIINTPDGQTILAAGQKVYLGGGVVSNEHPDDPAGMLVEVASGGTALNLGQIIANHGNVSIVALAVNQQGIIRASTSVRAGGSIFLRARDVTGVITTQDNTRIDGSFKNAGTVTLGPGSQTVVDVDLNDQEQSLDSHIPAATYPGQSYSPSKVTLDGNTININGAIVAHAGQVTATATQLVGVRYSSPVLSQDANTQINLGASGSIDVSGVDSTAPMSQNQIKLRLFSEQFKDAPLQRGGSLFSQTVYIDALKGTPLTDLAPSLALIGTTAAQKSAKAGNVTFSTTGTVSTDANSTINLSGGTVSYKEGFVRESYVIQNGKAVPISKADPNVLYQGLADSYAVTDAKWGVTRSWDLNPRGSFHAATSIGYAAGSLTVTGVQSGFTTTAYPTNVLLEGTLRAHTVIGSTQRQTAPVGGNLNVTLNGGVVHLSAPGSTLVAGDSHINTNIFDNGFDNLTLGFSDYAVNPTTITVDSAIHTGPKGSVSFNATEIDINANMTSPGGVIKAVVSPSVNGGFVPGNLPKGIFVADGVTLSTAGLLVNDPATIASSSTNADAIHTPLVLNGGGISLMSGKRGKDGDSSNPPVYSPGLLTLGKGSVLDASAGAWLDASNKLTGGNGGDISLWSGLGSTPQLLGSIKSYGFSKGGSFSLGTGSDVQVGGQAPTVAGTLWFPASFFEQGGFSSFSIASKSVGNSSFVIGDATGAPTLIHPKMQTLVPNFSAIQNLVTGNSLGLSNGGNPAVTDIATPVLLVEGMRTPTSVTFSAAIDTTGGNTSIAKMTVLPNTEIRTDVPVIGKSDRGNITVKGTDLRVYGNLIAPAGNITLGGFDVLVADTANLLARGYYAVPIGATNLSKADVLQGGSISVAAGELLTLRQGSLLDVSGTTGLVDVVGVKGSTRETLHGAAGTINISSVLGMALDGDLRGTATGNGKAGSLNVSMDDGGGSISDPAVVLTVTQARQVRAGSVVLGQGSISAEQIASGGFDKVNLKEHFFTSDLGTRAAGIDNIALESGLNLVVPGSLTLNSDLLTVTGNGVAQLSAPYVAFDGFSSSSATPGSATLKVNAGWIDVLKGASIAIAGVNTTEFNSRLDIRSTGTLVAPGALKLSARQIYVGENGNAANFQAVGANSRIEISSSGATSIPVLTAGSTLSFTADEIVQGGVLRSPFGKINLNATNKLTLVPGSLTSVSAEGQTLPFADLTSYGGWQVAGSIYSFFDKANGAPEKSIILASKSVNLQPGATVDISGGGDLEGSRFVPGIGGTKDILGGLPDGNGNPTVFAILPNRSGEYAPTGGSDAVYLTGIPGLAAGIYAKLPARYATMPGAYLLQASPGRQMLPNQALTQPDGTTLVSGYSTTLGTDHRDTRWSTYQLTDGSVFRPAKGTISKAPAEYFFVSGNQQFKDDALSNNSSVPRLPFDAGRLVLDASQQLALGGHILSNKPEGALGSQVDISTAKIAVVSNIDPSNFSGAIQITASDLSNLNVGSLLLGGLRGARQIQDPKIPNDPTKTIDDPDGTIQFKANATDVVFANDANHILAVPELFAVAKNNLTVNTGAALDTIASSRPAVDKKILADGPGALLAISGQDDLVYRRTNPSATNGILTVQNGSSIHAHRSLVMDATNTTTLSGPLTVNTGGSATLGANVVELGSSGVAPAGLRLDSTMLAGLGNIARMTVNSSSNVRIISPLNFGNQNLDIVFNTAGITGALGAGQAANLVAKTFTLENTAGVPFVATGTGNGTLNVNAKTIKLVGDPTQTNPTNLSNTTLGDGFATVNIAATGELLVSGTGTTTFGNGGTTTTLSSTRLAAASGSVYKLTTAGSLSTLKTAAPEALPVSRGLGAKIDLTAATLTLGGDVELPSGQFLATATTGNLTVASGANIKANSIPVNFSGIATEYTPAGLVALGAAAGNISVASGATIDVSGGGNADAGTLKLTAGQGDVNVAAGAVLNGQAATSREGGRFELDARTLPSFSNLNTTLNNGGFNSRRELRVRTGDIVIAAADTVTARSFVLSADGAGGVGGNIDVFGMVNADGNNGGNIELYAQKNLTLEGTAKLLARGTGDTLVARDGTIGAGGSVILSSYSTSANAISAAAGASIDVSGDQVGPVLGNPGKVTLRAMRTGVGAGDGVNTIATNVTAAVKGVKGIDASGVPYGAVRLEAVKTYGGAGAIDLDAQQATIAADTNTFITAATPGLAAYLTTQDGMGVVLAAGAEVQATGAAGTITTTAGWDLNTDPNTGTNEGTLTLRAAKNLAFNGSLSDGFSGTSVVAGDTTWGFNLISGADFTAANPFATNTSAGNMTVGIPVNGNIPSSGSQIRTGSQGIRIATGGDLTLADYTSAIYTIGRQLTAAEGVPGFVPTTGLSGGLYMTGGGSIQIKAKGSLIATPGYDLRGLPFTNNVTKWLAHSGNNNGRTGPVSTRAKDASWWPLIKEFNQGVAAFGGGNVSLQADNDIHLFSASIPTMGRYDTYTYNPLTNTNDLTGPGAKYSVDGGGNLRVEAGGNIDGYYYTGRGTVSVIAGGRFGTKGMNGDHIGDTYLALQDTIVEISAARGISVTDAFNPTADFGFPVNAIQGLRSYLTYSDRASVRLASASGDVNFWRGSLLNSLGQIQPGSMEMKAFDGDVRASAAMYPTSRGTLRLLANGNVYGSGGITDIIMSDVDPNALPNPFNPITPNLDTNGHSPVPMHLGDTKPVEIVANNGNIGIGATLAKAALIHAGQDITGSFNVEHSSPNDITVVDAGRDYSGRQSDVNGPGNLLIEAGRNVNVNQGSISSLANTVIKPLPSVGASITILAGYGKQGAKVADYIATYINPTGAGPSTLHADSAGLAEYRQQTAKAVGDYMRDLTGNAGLSDADAMTQYLALDANRQAVFAYRHFSSELAATGQTFAKTKSYARGDNAIATLIPAGSGYQGDITAQGTQPASGYGIIKTLRNSSIDLLAPGGLISTGLPGGDAGEIRTERGGAIRAFAEKDFQVNAGKVITQYGSDITVWVNNGDIDAGRGSKTAVSIPERQVTVDNDGNVTTIFNGVATGSGIRAQTFDPDGPNGPAIAPEKGSVTLVAPRGVLNVGEAGIEGGNVFLVAQTVVDPFHNVEAGNVVGLPAVDSGGLTGALSGQNTANAAKAASDEIAKNVLEKSNPFSTKNFMPSFITVEVIGLGK